MTSPDTDTPEAADTAWEKDLRCRIARTAFRSEAEAKIAEEIAKAIRQKRADRLRFLLDTPLPSFFSRHPKTPDVERVFDALHNLGENGENEARQKYPHLYDMRGTTPLMSAVIAGGRETVEVLLEKGAAPFQIAPSNPTGYAGPLGAAIFLGRYDLVEILMVHPKTQEELAEKPAFRNWLLLTAIGSDCAKTLEHLAACDPELLEKGRVYGDHRAADFSLGEGVHAYALKLKEQRAREEAERSKENKYGGGPLYRKRES
jgi:hypothetical protein